MLQNAELPESFKSGLFETTRKYGFSDWKNKFPDIDGREAELLYESLLAGALHAALPEDGCDDRETVVKLIMSTVNTNMEARS